MKLSPETVDFVIALGNQERQSLAGYGVLKLFDAFTAAGFPVNVVEIYGGWAS